MAGYTGGTVNESLEYKYIPDPKNYLEAEIRSSLYGRVLSKEVKDLPDMTSVPNRVSAYQWRRLPPKYKIKYVGRTFPLASRDAEEFLKMTYRRKYLEPYQRAQDLQEQQEYLARVENEDRYGLTALGEEEEKGILDFLEEIQVFGKADTADWY